MNGNKGQAGAQNNDQDTSPTLILNKSPQDANINTPKFSHVGQVPTDFTREFSFNPHSKFKSTKGASIDPTVVTPSKFDL